MKVKRQISLGFRDLAPLQLMINFWNKKSIQLFLIVHFILAALFLDTSCQIIKFYYTKSGLGRATKWTRLDPSLLRFRSYRTVYYFAPIY